MDESSRRSMNKALVLPTLIGIALSATIFWVMFSLERSRAELRFEDLAKQQFIAIRTNIEAAEASLDLIAGHFSSAPSGSTSRLAFAKMLQSVLDKNEFIQGYSWNPRVTAADLARYERMAEADGLAGFRVTEREDGKPVPVRSREEYVPIYYMEPISRNYAALGFDLASNPVRRAALEKARDEGVTQATGRIVLVQEASLRQDSYRMGGNGKIVKADVRREEQFGVLFLAPVFGIGGAGLPSHNRQNLTGYVSGVFRIGDLIHKSISREHVGEDQIDVHLFDMSAEEPERRLYPRNESITLAELQSGLHHAEDFEAGGRKWVLVARPSAAFVKENRQINAFLALAGGLVVTGLYLMILKGRITQAESATAFAREIELTHLKLDEAQRIARLVYLQIDHAHRCFVAGPGAVEIMGLQDEPASENLDGLFEGVLPEDCDRVKTAFLSGSPLDIEFRVAGQILHARSTEISDEGVMLITIQDVTNRRKAEEERAKMIEGMADADRLQALGIMAGGIAHEINTPTQYVGDNLSFIRDGVNGLLELAAIGKDIEAGKAERADFAAKLNELDVDFLAAELPLAADQALDGVARIGKIVQAIKEYSYPSSADPQSVDINRLVDVVATVTKNQWKYVAQMKFELDAEFPKIRAVEGEISQVLVNLIVNAGQAIEAQKRSEPGNILIRTRRIDGHVELSVIDDGPGIPAENLKRVFELFFTTKAPGKGTGQGLAISRAIIQRHQGDISVTSRIGEGTCFTIRLPEHAVTAA